MSVLLLKFVADLKMYLIQEKFDSIIAAKKIAFFFQKDKKRRVPKRWRIQALVITFF